MELVETTISDVTQYSLEKTRAETEIDIEVQYQKERGKPMPSKNHSKIQSRLSTALNNSYSENFDIFTEFELVLLKKKCVPDISIFPIQPSDWENDIIRGTETPLLTIEILSPKQALDDIISKIRSIYFPSGVLSAWVVLPSLKTILVMTPDGDLKTFKNGNLKDNVSGFDIDLDKLFK